MATSIARRDRRHPSAVLITAVAASLLLGACSAGGASTPSGAGASTSGSAASGGQTSAPSTAASDAPAASQGSAATASAGATPIPPSDDLAAMIPTEIAGHPMRIEPYTDSFGNFLILWNDAAVARSLLTSLGKTEVDVKIVSAMADDIEYPATLFVYAYQVKGADGKALMDGMVERYLGMLEGMAAPTKTVGGKTVRVMGPASSPEKGGLVWYSVGDVAFNVSSSRPVWIAAAVELLP